MKTFREVLIQEVSPARAIEYFTDRALLYIAFGEAALAEICAKQSAHYARIWLHTLRS